MKYFKVFIGILLTALLVPNIVRAEDNAVLKLKAPSTASKDEEITLDIGVQTSVPINEFKATITYETTALEILSIENKNGWKQETGFSNESPLSLTFTHENGLAGKITLATIKFRVKKDVAKSSTTISVDASTKARDDETINPLEKASVKIDIKSTDNTLSDLKVNGKTVVNFSPSTYTYSMQVDASVTTVNIEAELNDKTATFKDKYGSRKGASLDYGENTFEIIVVSASKDEKKYEITITRQDNRGTNNNLSDVIINSNRKLLEFDENTLLYTITTHKLEKITITVIPQDQKATVKIDNLKKGETEGEIPIEVGSNTITIKVASEKKELKEYKVIINNLDTDIDTSLKNIDVFGIDEEFNFDPKVYDYEIMFKPKYKDSLVIKTEVSNSDDAKVEIDREDFRNNDFSKLKAGDKIIITVSAKDGTEGAVSYYTIKFTKDTRINFFLILGLFIFIVLLIVFIRLLIKNKKSNKTEIKKEDKKELEKTKRLEKINLE